MATRIAVTKSSVEMRFSVSPDDTDFGKTHFYVSPKQQFFVQIKSGAEKDTIRGSKTIFLQKTFDDELDANDGDDDDGDGDEAVGPFRTGQTKFCSKNQSTVYYLFPTIYQPGLIIVCLLCPVSCVCVCAEPCVPGCVRACLRIGLTRVIGR